MLLALIRSSSLAFLMSGHSSRYGIFFIPHHTIVAGYYGFTLDIRVSVHQSYVRFSLLDDNFSKHQWIFTKLGMCIDIQRSGLGLLMGKFR